MTSRLARSPRPLLPVLAALLAVGAGCSQRGPTTASTPATSASTAATSSTSPNPQPTTADPTTSGPTTTPAPSTTTPAPSCAERIVARLSPGQRAGQLLMVGVHPSASPAALARQVSAQQLGGVIFLGGWHSGAPDVRAVATRLQAAATARAASAHGAGGLLVAADQEGGQVQQLRGPGFTRLPSARAQASLGTATLQRRAASWAGELKRAGVNVNLAPVADTVPTSLGDGNAPIGALDRDFVPGSPSANGRYAAAFVR
ncbi:MAG TPA: glycoside hydrolase family 3 N-terminal domain-containing protein, partial [Pedococcus sp.]